MRRWWSQSLIWFHVCWRALSVHPTIHSWRSWLIAKRCSWILQVKKSITSFLPVLKKSIFYGSERGVTILKDPDQDTNDVDKCLSLILPQCSSNDNVRILSYIYPMNYSMKIYIERIWIMPSNYINILFARITISFNFKII